MLEGIKLTESDGQNSGASEDQFWISGSAPTVDIFETTSIEIPSHFLLVPHGSGVELRDENDSQIVELFFESSRHIEYSLLSTENVQLRDSHAISIPIALGGRGARLKVKASADSPVRVIFKNNESDFLYQKRISDDSEHSWLRTSGTPSLNYILDTPRSGVSRRNLLVVFSAISQVGDFSYNYRRSLRGIDIPVLYIVDDFGDQGSYYIGRSGDEEIARSVQSLIDTTCKDLGILPEGVIFAGSSKGGSAALIHGLKFGKGTALLGAPQYLIGDFLEAPHKNVLEYVTGGVTPAHVNSLNDYVPSLFKMNGDQGLKIRVLVGERDHHYRTHVLPLLRDAERASLKVKLHLLENTPHSEVGTVFGNYVLQNSYLISRNSGEPALPNWLIRESKNLRIKVAVEYGAKAHFRLFKDGVLVQTRGYSSSFEAEWADLVPGTYYVRVTIRHPNSNPVAFNTKQSVIR